MANEFKVKKGLIVDGSNTVLDIQGTQGQLFSVTDSLTGDLFSVSDVSGIPIFNVNASGLSTFDGGADFSGIIKLTKNTATGLANNAFSHAKTIIGGLHFANGNGPGANNGNQAAITFQGSSASEAQAGIYVHNNNSQGTHMLFATTDSYNAGPKAGITLLNNGNVTIRGTVGASNFSGSSSGSNTGDQTLPTLSSLGGASNGYLTNTGGAKLEIQNSVDGGSANGIYMWNTGDTNWGIYMGQAGTSKSLSDGVAASGIDGRTEHAIRFRAADSTVQIGFLWENNNEEALMQLVTDTGKLFTRGAVYPSNQTTNHVDSTRIANWQTAYGWGDHSGEGYLTASSTQSKYLRSDVADTASGRISFNNCDTNNHDTIATSTGSLGAMEIYNNGSGNDAFMTFHVGGDFACYFGLDGGTNKLSVGGWSMGANSYEIYHSGNKPSPSDIGAQAAGSYLTSDANYLKSNADDTFTGKLSVGSSSSRRAGMYGIYNSGLIGHIWSMGTAYQIPQNGANFGNLYGLAYKHTNNTTGGTMAGSHQMVWCQNGTPYSAMGTNIWTSGSYTGGTISVVGSSSFVTSGTGTLTCGGAGIFGGSGTGDVYIGNNATGNFARFHTNNSNTYFDMNCGVVYWRQGSNTRFQHNMTSGTFTSSADVIAYGSPSDVRLKENIKPIESALDKAMKLQGVTFDWKKSDSILNIKEDVGFIAQDVQKVVPELVRENEDGMLSMRHQGIAPILLEAIKELKAEIEELKKQIK